MRWHSAFLARAFRISVVRTEDASKKLTSIAFSPIFRLAREMVHFSDKEAPGTIVLRVSERRL